MRAIANDKYDITKIFDDMALDLIKSQRRTFLRHQGEQLKEGFQWEQWQLAKLRELRKYRQANKEIIDNYSGEINKLIDEALTGSYNKGQDNIEKAIDKIKQLVIDIPENGVDPDSLKRYTQEDIRALKDAESLIEVASKLPKATGADTFFNTNDKKLRALQQVVKKDMRKAQNAVLRKMDDVYRQTVYKAQVYMSTGASTLDQAVDMATNDFLEQGINCIQYKDGKMVNVASWAEMALRTASHRATMLGEGSKMDEWSMHLVVITAHGNTCDLCLPWQGKVLIDDVYASGKPDGVHTLLSTAMAAGLFHPNCRHSRALYFEGITELPKQPVDDEAALSRYNAEQKQRNMERKIRKYKRLEAGSVDPDNQAKYGEKVQEWQGVLRDHVKSNTHLRKNASRTAVDGSLTVKQRNDNLKKAAENVKIKEIRDSITSGKQPLEIEEGKQGKHILEHNNYTHGRSYITVSQNEAQDIIKSHAGKGDIKLNRKKEFANKETINTDRVMGVNVNNQSSFKTLTSKGTIHYSKNGTHLVPTSRARLNSLSVEELKKQAKILAKEYYPVSGISFGNSSVDEAIEKLINQPRSKNSLIKDIKSMERKLLKKRGDIK